MFGQTERIAYRFARWAVLALVVLLAAVGSSQEAPTPAMAAGLTAEFSIAAFDGGVQLKNTCDSHTESDFKCTVHPGGTFEVEVYLDKLPPDLPDGDDPDSVGGYRAIGLRLDHSPGLAFETASEVWQWPDCDDNFDDSADVELVNLACISEQPNASTFSSEADPVVELMFTCPAFKSTETITLVYGTRGDKLGGQVLPYDTVVVDENGANLTQSGATETLVINCTNIFPWDLDGDDAVSAQDIFEEIAHFNQTKPTP
jgi:hypothetical protein